MRPSISLLPRHAGSNGSSHNGMGILTVLLFGLMSEIGCTTTEQVVEPAASNPFVASRLSREVAGQPVSITLTNGSEIEGRDFRFGEDSCIWLDPSTKELHTVYSKQIAKISLKNELRGTLEGFGVGLLTGFAVGALFGSMSRTLKSDFFDLGPVAAAGIGGAIGAGIGLVNGLVRGHKDVYEFLWFNRLPPPEPGPAFSRKINLNSDR